jgi:predicted nucleic acid-binding protein
VIVLDANVLIAHLTEDDALHTRAKTVVLGLENEVLAVSVLTLAAVLVTPARRDAFGAATRAVDRLGIATLELSAGDAGALAMLRAETSLKLPDCCVLLAAERHHAGLATFDARLAGVARSRGLQVIPGE